jgi:hypothetical protein
MARNSIDVAAVPKTVSAGTKNAARFDANRPERGAELEYELGPGSVLTRALAEARP